MAAATTYAVLVELLKARQLKELREKFEELNVVDIADFIERLAGEDIVIAFRALHKDTAAEVFSYLSYDMQEQIVKSITDQEIANIINELFVDDAADFLEEMPAGVVKRVLKNASPDTRALINQFLQYPPDSAGSIRPLSLWGSKTMTVRDAFARIRGRGRQETIYTCYVMDETAIWKELLPSGAFMAPEDTPNRGYHGHQDYFCHHHR